MMLKHLRFIYLVLLMTFISLLSFKAHSSRSKTLCNGTDERTPTFFSEIGRGQRAAANFGCTVALIGRTCAISAGHCGRHLEVGHFNTLGAEEGVPLPSRQEDIYRIDQESINLQAEGAGKDWAVFRFLPNSDTHAYPGDRQGYLRISYFTPKLDAIVDIIGYGRSADPNLNFTQQGHVAQISSIDGTILRHVADTMGGNSGGPILDYWSRALIGVHTHGGCHLEDLLSNAGTLLIAHSEFLEAAHQCLIWEQENL